MLTQEIKKHLDSARDILVGKVPDPKAQVEQITIALIYKFMDDMDMRSASLPKGKRQFFVNGYEKYSWSKVMDGRLGGQERLNLYAEAVAQMSANKHLPQLFRDIFKDAFLPYRDPETLSLFLKEINGFTYDHSENLGNAFEYLLLILGSQGDAGQFRTPRHIIDFIVEVVDPKKNESLLDPACGTAGFLISAYKHILKANTDKTLTPDERKRLMRNIVGYDISPDMVKLSLVNLYLHGFPSPSIFEYDPLTSEDKWDETFDIIMANPPFMTPKGGVRPHARFSVKANRTEVLFSDYLLEHLNPSGRAGFIVPEGVLHNQNSATKKLRKMLIDAGAWAIVELPHGTFKPYASVKTHIVFVDASQKRRKEMLFVKITNDGYTQTDARRTVHGSELPEAVSLIKRFQNQKQISANEELEYDIVKKSTILSEPMISLVGRRYLAQELALHSKWGAQKLNEKLVRIEKGKSATEQTPPGQYTFVVTAEKNKTADHYDFEGEAVCIPLVSSTGHGHASVRRVHYIDGKFALANIMCAIFVINEKVLLPKYLYYTLSAQKEKLLASLMTGTSNVSMDKDDLYTISIPLPPLNIQKEFVLNAEKEELEIIKLFEAIENKAEGLMEKAVEIWGHHKVPAQRDNKDWFSIKLGIGAVLESLAKTPHERGEMVVAKLMYILQEIYNIPFSLVFARHKFGPYDPDIKKAILSSAFGKDKFFAVKGSGERQVYSLGSNAQMLFKYNAKILQGSRTALKELMEDLSRERSSNIELLATVSKIIQDIKSTDLDRVEAEMELWKPGKYQRQQIVGTLEYIKHKEWDRKLVRI